MNKKGGLIGGLAFLIGVVIALVAGFVDLNQTWIVVLVVLGVLIGLLNVTEEEMQPFLLASVSLVIVAALGGEVMDTIKVLGKMMDAVLILFVPATVVVAVKSVFGLAKR